MLEPQGPAAAHITGFWWLIFALGTVIYVAVMGFTLFALFRRRDRPFAAVHGDNGARLIVLAGIVGPGLVLVTIFGFSLNTLDSLAIPARAQEITVHVTGHQWWWEVAYPDEDVVTANEIHIPVGRPVLVHLSSADVVHNFWVPELHGKIDMTPGQTNTFWLQADAAGAYRGECAEFCGTQHGKMAFIVVAEPQEDFAAWLAQQRQPAPAPTDPLTRFGQQVFLGSACVYCHTVAGTNATGKIGPDLTHIASRRTLGAGAVANNVGNLAGWVVNPHSMKPGNLMPATNLPGDELQAMLAYLQTLE